MLHSISSSMASDTYDNNSKFISVLQIYPLSSRSICLIVTWKPYFTECQTWAYTSTLFFPIYTILKGNESSQLLCRIIVPFIYPKLSHLNFQGWFLILLLMSCWSSSIFSFPGTWEGVLLNANFPLLYLDTPDTMTFKLFV